MSAADDLPPIRAGAGRPRDPGKERAILAVAHRMFLAHGFGETTLEEVAREAGVSKATLYNRFSDKEALFEAVAQAQVERMAEAFNGATEANASLEVRLNAFGVALMSFLFHADHVALDRILAQALQHHRALGQRFFAVGPGQCRTRLAAVLVAAADRGQLAIANPREAAEHLLALWKGFVDVELKFGIAPDLDPRAVRARVESGTRVFLRAYAADAAG